MTDSTFATAADYAAFGVIVTTIIGWLPAISALLSIVWLLLRIWESDTVRELSGRKDKPNGKPNSTE